MPMIRTLLAACALAASGALWAQCGVSMTCTDAPTGIPGLPGIGLPGVCKPGVCLKDDAKAEYEIKHHCKFPAGDMCGEKAISTATQCCTKDAQSGKAKIRNKQITVLDGEFNWDAYKKECTGMRQSEAPPDGLWAMCEIEELHDPTNDKWPVKEVIKNPSNPRQRPFCVDGCSTPPAAITAAFKLQIFLVKDKDNPTGHEKSNFYDACKIHDICYQTCSINSQVDCDTNLRDQSLAVCEQVPPEHSTPITFLGISKMVNTRFKCRDAAREMFRVLSTWGFGDTAFKKRRQQMCQCC
jgi:hypothetical protein